MNLRELSTNGLIAFCLIACLPRPSNGTEILSPSFDIEVVQDGFESRELFEQERIEVVGSYPVLYTGESIGTELNVRVLLPTGDLDTTSELTWEESGSGGYVVGPISARSVYLQSSPSVSESGSDYITVRVADRALELRVPILSLQRDPAVIELVPSAILQIQGDTLGHHTAILDPALVSSSVDVGKFVFSLGETSLLAHVLQTSTTSSGELIVNLEPASMQQVFPNIVLEDFVEPSSTTRFAKDRKSLAVDAPAFSCSPSLNLGTNVDIRNVDLDWSLSPAVRMRNEGGELKEFRLGIKGEVGFSLEARTSIGLENNLEALCKLKAPDLILGNGRLGPIRFRPMLQSEVSVRFKLASAGTLPDIQESTLTRRWRIDAGIIYTPEQGWSDYGEATQSEPEGAMSLDTSEPGFSAEVALINTTSVAVRACLGVCTALTSIADLRLLEAAGGPFLKYELSPPLEESSRLYAGPSMSSGAQIGAAVSIQARFTNELIRQYIGVGATAGFTIPLIQETLVTKVNPTPAIVFDCGGSCSNGLSSGETVDVSVDFSRPDLDGIVSLWGQSNDSEELSHWLDIDIAQSTGTGDLVLPSGEDGPYEVYARYSLLGYSDSLSSVYPYALVNPVLEYSLGDQPDLSVGATRLNDTGILYCKYGAMNNLSCPQAPYFPQDGDIGRDVTAVTKVGAGIAGFDFTKLSMSGEPLPAEASTWFCVRDNHTGLVWENKSLQPEDFRYFGHRFVWFSSNSETNGGGAGSMDGGNCPLEHCNTEAYIEAVNQIALCGRQNWRSPSAPELINLANFGTLEGVPDTHYFEAPPLFSEWSSTPASPTTAWPISGYGGPAVPSLKSSAKNFRVVCSD